jgi:hypothetical protein
MGDIIFVASPKYRNKCKVCGKYIEAGMPSYWEKGTRNNWHEYCYKPNAPANSPGRIGVQISRKAGDQTPSGSPHTDPKKEGANTEARMKLARKKVAEVFGEDEDSIRSDNPMVVEVMCEEYGLLWLDKQM